MPIQKKLKIHTVVPLRSISTKIANNYTARVLREFLYDVIKLFKEEIKKDDLSIRASSISFYFIMALFPTIIFFFYDSVCAN